jgi:diguanylate cyclase (GGDEF)-like protein
MRPSSIVDADDRLYRKLYDASIHDPLTRVFNRQYIGDRLLAEISHARRTNGEVVALMVDVDFLEEINDWFGHLVGDRALCAMAARIQLALRVEDKLARYGDEFVVVTVGTTSAEALQLAERIRRAVEGLRVTAQGRRVRITASVGVAALSEIEARAEPVAALLALADARVRGAKAAGRNRICTGDPSPPLDDAMRQVEPDDDLAGPG